MLRRSFWPCFPLALAGCDPEIVLGDSLREPAAESGGSSGSGGSSSSDLLPRPGVVLWSTDHEGGDVSAWLAGGTAQGGQYYWGEAYGEVQSDVGRDASRGLAMGIDTSFRGEPSQGARVYRRIQEEPAFYSAWFKLEEAHTVSDWWSIFLFHARDASLSLDNDVSLWDVRVVEGSTGGMVLQFFDHDTGTERTADGIGSVAPGVWFELRAHLDYRPPAASRLRVWLDSALLFDLAGLHTSVEEHVFWAIGNGAAVLDPSYSTLYVDDAAIRGVESAP